MNLAASAHLEEGCTGSAVQCNAIPPVLGVRLSYDSSRLYCCIVEGHTARLAAVLAGYGAAINDTRSTALAVSSWNWASYAMDTTGAVAADPYGTPSHDQIWFTVSLPMIYESLNLMAALPQLCPRNRTHLLFSSAGALVTDVRYEKGGSVAYQVSADAKPGAGSSMSKQKLHVARKPVLVEAGARRLVQRHDLEDAGWIFDALSGAMEVLHDATNVTITLY